MICGPDPLVIAVDEDVAVEDDEVLEDLDADDDEEVLEFEAGVHTTIPPAAPSLITYAAGISYRRFVIIMLPYDNTPFAHSSACMPSVLVMCSL